MKLVVPVVILKDELLDRTRRAINLRGLPGDYAFYGVMAAFAGIMIMVSTNTPPRIWAAIALWGYLLGVVFSAQIPRFMPTLATRDAARRMVLGCVLAITIVLPLAVLIAQRTLGVSGRAEIEVGIIEASATRLIDTGTPYRDVHGLPGGPVVEDYMPYLPGMVIFGLPRLLAGVRLWTDARVWFGLTAFIVLGVAVVVAGLGHGRWRALPVRLLQIATATPFVAIPLVTGGDDLPVLALMLLALAFAGTQRPAAAGAAAGIAAAMKFTAWPLAIVIGVSLLTRDGARIARQYAVAVGGVVIAVVLPVFVVAPGLLIEHTLLFPAGLTEVRSPAASPLPGRLLANFGSIGHGIALVLVSGAVIAIVIHLLLRPPRTIADAATRTAVGLTLATALTPATRFGYLVYPLVLGCWVWLVHDTEGRAELRKLQTVEPVPASTREPVLVATGTATSSEIAELANTGV